jgi:uncharacterized protein (DUF1800 family)
MDPITLKARYERSQRVVVEQLQSQKIIRAIYSQRQLQEVMVDFWFNHFNVNWSKDGVQFAVTGYERDAIRPFALGKFKDLLRATAGHPAMLVYLDNALSNSAGTNENYARELMELHTLGIDGGYTQKDVEEVARIFTGWTVSADGGAFSFNGERHVPGDKVVLGRTISSGGRSEGEAVLDMLARHPRTADFISTKLVRRFVADKPPASLVQRVAQVFTETDGDIRAMITTILTSEEFRDPKAFRAKAKSPFEAVVSAMRAVDADLQASLDDRVVEGELRGLLPGDVVLTKVGRMSRVSPAIILTRAIQDMGQFPYQVPEPTGYPDRGDYWLNGSSVLRRAMFAVSLMSNEVLGTRVDVPRLQTALPVTSPSDINWNDALPVVTMPSALPPPGKPAANDPSIAVINAFALALGSPEFQHK